MTTYNVHIYREMRLYFPGIEAGSPEEAAALARAKPTEDAASTEDCDGETLAALVYEHSVTIDFEDERMRKAAPALLKALDYLLEQTVDMDLKHGIGLTEGEEEARAKALAAIAQATDISGYHAGGGDRLLTWHGQAAERLELREALQRLLEFNDQWLVTIAKEAESEHDRIVKSARAALAQATAGKGGAQ
jgi:hypothetical protein